MFRQWIDNFKADPFGWSIFWLAAIAMAIVVGNNS